MVNDRHRTYIIISFFTLIIATAVLIVYVYKTNFLKDTGVLYGGQTEKGYPAAGYLLSYKEGGKYQICGNVVLSANMILTAAHCLEKQTDTYIGLGDFRLNRNLNTRVIGIRTLEEWNGQDSGNDLAILALEKSLDFDKEYATIVEPKLGCNYTVVGYGRTESENYFGSNRPRNSIDVCIKKIDDRTFTLQGILGGICFGDSGSPIFEKGTNKVVGVISALIVPKDENQQVCRVENQAIATRLDKNLEFVYGNNNQTNNIAKCGETCRYNKCGDGLSCSPVTLLCNIEGEPNCKVAADKSCNPLNNILCDDGLVCVSGKCEQEPNLITSNPDVQLIFGVLANPLEEKNFPIILWVLIASTTFAIIGQSLNSIRRNKNLG